MSIKKKFVTAVATAGLLAGLFGSALVPSALARGTTAATPVKAHSDVYNGTGDNYNYSNYRRPAENGYVSDFSTSTKNQFTMIVMNTNEDDPTMDHSLGFYLGDASNDAIETADLSATSSGIVKVAFAYQQDEATHASRCEANELPYGLTDSVKAVESHGYSLGDDTRHLHEGAGEYFLCLDPISYTTPGVSTITITANGVKIFTLTVKVLGDLKSLTVSTTYGSNAVAEGNMYMDNFFKLVGKDAAGQVLNGSGYADGASGSDNGFFLWTWINSGLDQLGENSEDGSTTAEHQNGDYIDYYGDAFAKSHDNDGSLAQLGETWRSGSYAWELVDLEDDVCVGESYDGAGDGDAGHSFVAGFETHNDHDVLIQSNTVTISCTGPSDEAVATAITAETAVGAADWAASTAGKADADGLIGVYATVKDAAGRAMGYDDTIFFNIDSSADFDSELDLTEWQMNSVGGKVLLGYIVPDMSALAKYSYTFTIDDPDQADSDGNDQADLEKTLYYTATSGITSDYSISRTRNAAKTQATFTADYGVACSNARIGFEWENNDGSKYGSVTRKANIDGVAKFVMNRRNTKIWVYATGCDNYSEDTDPIGARFK